MEEEVEAAQRRNCERFHATPMRQRGAAGGGHVRRHFDQQIGTWTVHCSTMCTKHTTAVTRGRDTHVHGHARSICPAIGAANGKEDERALTSRLGKRIIAGLFIRPAKGPPVAGNCAKPRNRSSPRFSPDLRPQRTSSHTALRVSAGKNRCVPLSMTDAKVIVVFCRWSLGRKNFQ